MQLLKNLTLTISTMSQDTKFIYEKVNSYILQAAYAGIDDIKNDTLIFKEGFFDSMGFVMLISFLEEEYGFKIKDEELLEDNFESIDAITGFITRKAK
jgi:acyl carrier protein